MWILSHHRMVDYSRISEDSLRLGGLERSSTCQGRRSTTPLARHLARCPVRLAPAVARETMDREPNRVEPSTVVLGPAVIRPTVDRCTAYCHRNRLEIQAAAGTPAGPACDS